jgi:hypothetical protein
MSLFDRIFVGKVIKDFGILEENSFFFGKVKKSMLLAERRGKLKIAFKWSGYALFGASVSYFDLAAESIPKLRQFVAEAEEFANQQTGILNQSR